MKRIQQSRGSLRRNGSVAASWAVSYILILLIPIASAVGSFFVTTNTIKEEIVSANQLILSNLRGEIDKLMQEELAAYAFLFTNTQLTDLTRNRFSDAEFHYAASQFPNLLSSFNASESGMGILIYLKEKDYLISPKTANKSAFLYNAQKAEAPAFPDYSAWKESLSGDYSNEFFVSDELSLYRYRRSLVYGSTLAFAGGNTANVFISYPLSQIADMVSNLSGSVLILADGAGHPVAAFDSSGETAIPENIAFISGTETANAVSGREMGGKSEGSFICTSVQSTQSPWRFAILTPEKIFWQKAKYCVTLNIASLLAALAVGLLFAFLFVRRHYRPISGILSLLDRGSTEGNEFDRFRTAYVRLCDENRSMKDAMQKQQETLRESYLLSCLKGRGSKLPSAESNSFFELSMDGPFFGLAAISIDPPKDAVEDFDELAFFATDNAFRELMSAYATFYKIEDGRFLYYLFILSETERGRWEDDCYEQLQKLLEIFEKKLEISLTAAVSRTEDSFRLLHNLYEEVMEALAFRSVVGGSEVMRGDDLKEPDEAIHLQREKLNQILFGAIAEGDTAYAHSIADALLQVYEKKSYLSFTAFRLTMMDSLNTVLNAFYSSVHDHEARLALTAQMENLLSSPNEENFRDGFQQMITFACHAIRTVSEKENPDLSRKVREYIDAHYMESALNISAIADALNRSPRYLSRVFKAETGEGILDYINLVRVRKAKELMAQRDISCEELSGLVGYTNVRTFRRAFQKVEGTTPGKYAGDESHD